MVKKIEKEGEIIFVSDSDNFNELDENSIIEEIEEEKLILNNDSLSKSKIMIKFYPLKKTNETFQGVLHSYYMEKNITTKTQKVYCFMVEITDENFISVPLEQVCYFVEHVEMSYEDKTKIIFEAKNKKYKLSIKNVRRRESKTDEQRDLGSFMVLIKIQ